MNPRLQRVQHIFRRLHVLPYIETGRYWYKNIRNRKKNLEFQKNHPDFPLPPEHLAFDAHGTIDWESYKNNGANLAERIVIELKESDQADGGAIFEWGCGPGRVIRHMPDLLNDSTLVGSDYNDESIKWCSAYISNVTFVKNELEPPLPIAIDSFDFIYAISVFTHLSEDLCHRWIKELSRVLKPNGLVMIWTNGDVISNFLLPEEKAAYSSGRFVVRDQYEEGKKMFLSFHPPKWVRENLLKDYQIIKYFPGGFTGTAQDIWFARLTTVDSGIQTLQAKKNL